MDMLFSEPFRFDQSAVYSTDDDSWKLQVLNADAIARLDQSLSDAETVLGRYLQYDQNIFITVTSR